MSSTTDFDTPDQLRALHCRRVGRLVRITLDNHDARNAIDQRMAHELLRVASWCDGLPNLGAVLIEATGQHFSVGGNMRELSSRADHLAKAIDDLLVPYHEALTHLAELPAPVVCAVQGAVVGGALGLLGVADIVIAADNLTVRSAFSSVGLSGDGGSTWYLPRLIGLRRTQELYLTERTLNAEEALRWGLVTRVVASAELAADSLRTAVRLAEGPTTALGASRRLLQQSGSNTRAEQLGAEHDAMLRCAASKEAIARVRGFFEDRHTSAPRSNHDDAL